ncbi:MAG: hypothetical protein ACLRS1_03320 [Oscillospiraceae bacterium]
MYTRKRRRFKVTPGKLEELRVNLVEMRETPAKGGETLEGKEEPKRSRYRKMWFQKQKASMKQNWKSWKRGV